MWNRYIITSEEILSDNYDHNDYGIIVWNKGIFMNSYH